MIAALALTLSLALTAAPTPAPASAAAESKATGGALAELEQQQQKLFESVAPGVVFILCGDHFGSGFFVTRDGLILTNAHVVEGKPKVEVVLRDGRRLPGTVVEKAADKIDLALVQIAVADAPVPARATLADVRIGSWVGSIGHGRGAIWTFNSGMVSNIYPEGADHPVFQTQIPLNPGNSGGPIFDRQGRVVGIVTAGITDASAINFGIAMDVAFKSLSRLASVSDLLIVKAPKGVPVFVDGVMAGTGPRVAVPAVAGKTYEVFSVIEGAMKKATAKFPETREIRAEVADLTPGPSPASRRGVTWLRERDRTWTPVPSASRRVARLAASGRGGSHESRRVSRRS
ncbi:MAG: serine protease [Myxococcales bacterium]